MYNDLIVYNYYGDKELWIYFFKQQFIISQHVSMSLLPTIVLHNELKQSRECPISENLQCQPAAIFKDCFTANF